ncbi:hypothetical protein FHS43_003874 [Streptosporangium becharense]|uniref:Uncharacterized protein n=1 Tax=Streptosporangium becharense TaxID=1816182 RepID=A0A7W9IGZ5_9ACTN|nr:hypothetical protein [Streptosporangium becharense]MBB2912591.1 hypothetical protein [Streptosporangium becharense]MBB5820579.1 hypothetical protein [Streptosporangium becharense]
MSVTEFTDVTTDKDRGVTPRTGLYEFWTDEGAHVYLHDTDFSYLTYQPGRPPMLELEFVHDPWWAPPELATMPVVVFRFEDVRIIEWCENQEGHDCVTARPDAPPGQVDCFDWDGNDLPVLDIFTLRLTFRASRVAVAVRTKQNEEPS